MAWDETIKTSDFDEQASAATRTTTRSGGREGAPTGGIFSSGFENGNNPGWFQSTFMGATSYDVVGISADKIPEMRDAIRAEVQGIHTYLDGITVDTDADGAYKSEEVQRAVQAYIAKVKEYSKALTSDLLAFSDKLQDVYDAWKLSTDTFATDSIDPSTSQFDSVTDQYVEQN